MYWRISKKPYDGKDGIYPEFCNILKNPPQEAPQKTANTVTPLPPTDTTKKTIAAKNEALEKQRQEEERAQQQILLLKEEKIKNEILERKKEKEVLFENQEDLIAIAKERSRIVTLFMGSDYKNNGQLRSEIVKNDALIKKIQNQLADDIDEEDKATLQGELQQLLNQQERIRTILASNENSFSLFGWVFKFINGVQ